MSSAEQQATNAALATLAATGNSYALGQLWETNRGIIRSMFWRYGAIIIDDLDDL